MKKKWIFLLIMMAVSFCFPVCAADMESEDLETVILDTDEVQETETFAPSQSTDTADTDTAEQELTVEIAAESENAAWAEAGETTGSAGEKEAVDAAATVAEAEEAVDTAAVVSSSLQGIVTENGYTYYYVNGKCQTGWQTVGGNTYYFYKSSKNDVPKGAAATGLTKISGYYYYFNSKGVMQTGKKTISGKIYYFYKSAKGSAPKGSAATGLVKISGSYYYFTSTGKAYTNKWKTVKNASGESYKYYFRSNGKAYADTVVEIDGATYAFDSSGHMLTGVQVIDHKFYVFNSGGKLNETKTSKLRNASVYESDASTLTRLLEKYGATLKETIYYGESCYGNGEDGELVYDTFTVYVFQYASSGKVIVFSVA